MAGAAGGGGERANGSLVKVAQAQEIFFSHAEQDGQSLLLLSLLLLEEIWLVQSPRGGCRALAESSALLAGQEGDQQDSRGDQQRDLHDRGPNLRGQRGDGGRVTKPSRSGGEGSGRPGRGRPRRRCPGAETLLSAPLRAPRFPAQHPRPRSARPVHPRRRGGRSPQNNPAEQPRGAAPVCPGSGSRRRPGWAEPLRSVHACSRPAPLPPPGARGSVGCLWRGGSPHELWGSSARSPPPRSLCGQDRSPHPAGRGAQPRSAQGSASAARPGAAAHLPGAAAAAGQGGRRRDSAVPGVPSSRSPSEPAPGELGIRFGTNQSRGAGFL